MDFISFLGVLRRHWVIVSLGILLTAAATVGAFKSVKPEYSSSASMLLFAPKPPAVAESTVAEPQNPYLSFGSNLNIMGAIMAERFKDPGVRQQVIDSGATEEFIVSVGGGDNPLIVVEVEGATPTATSATLAVVLDSLAAMVQQNQLDAGASPDFLITTRLLRQEVEPTVEQGSRTRAGATAAILGIALTIGLAFLVETLTQRRHARRAPVARGGASILEREAVRSTAIPASIAPAPTTAAAQEEDKAPVARWGRAQNVTRPARRDPA